MKRFPDQVFIEKALNGDTRAFGSLVENYQDYVFTIIYRIVKVREEAEEVAQDTFLKAFESLNTFRGDAKFSTWLFRIAYRKALDRIRKNKGAITFELVEEITGGESLKDFENGLESMLNEERSQKINECILKLPEQEAAIITLFYFEEQSIKEISQITGLTEDNIKVKLHRSRKLLFSLLEKYFDSAKILNHGKAI